ncbi:hypothetical protein HDV00_008170 [Rhizophlyctis rosea]|nr:hypothetical protein HDV00_008170 [Rhizophlyctis rosea]
MLSPLAPHSDSIPLVGVHFSFFREFIDQYGGRAAFHNLTTANVCEKFIKPETAKTESYCEKVAKVQNTGVRRPGWFISHSWQYRFLDVADAIESFFSDEGNLYKKDDKIVWFDLFSLPQQNRPNLKAKWLQTSFMTAISAMKSVVMIIPRWDQPIILSRAWCIFEIYAANVTFSFLHVAMPPHGRDDFIQIAYRNPSLLLEKVANINSEASEATKPKDLDAIRTAICESVGFDALDRLVFSTLAEWMVKALDSKWKIPGRVPVWNDLSLRDRIARAQFFFQLGCIFMKQNELKGAMKKLRECVRDRQMMLGNAHPDTCSAVSVLIEANLRSLEESRNRFGHTSRQAIDNTEELVRLYQEHGKFPEARGVLLHCLKESQDEHGDQHELTVRCVNKLADVLCNRDNPQSDLAALTEAEKLYRQGSSILKGKGDAEGFDFTHRLARLGHRYADLKEWKHVVRLHAECTALISNIREEDLDARIYFDFLCRDIDGLRSKLPDDVIPLESKSLTIETPNTVDWAQFETQTLRREEPAIDLAHRVELKWTSVQKQSFKPNPGALTKGSSVRRAPRGNKPDQCLLQ